MKKAAAIVILCSVLFGSCASRDAARADEYFSMGMAYYDLGKYEDAERWFNRAKAIDKTMTASEYNLGRIAFETGRYEDAAGHFEKIVSRDPENVMALKSAAYSRIKNGDLLAAETHYSKVLALVPESADDGFNYALVLYALKKYPESESTLQKYSTALEENSDALLLLARAEGAQNKVEAADSYNKWLTVSTPTAQVLYEYAQVLEKLELYARAIEQYKASVAALREDTNTLKKSSIRYEAARLMLTADPENDEAIVELDAAIEAGFTDTKILEDLMQDPRITQAHKDSIQKSIDAINNPPAPPASEGDGQTGADAPKE
ncbi:tetratricopeptide repeat protein [Leadbettera azotonutricia]|uniref:Putative TPR domain protein n=1 Tax=Leadbettera azotonutricia (strain ATCC BAA-888 / DSM 13862 / ZAS-9) TaxID=545695 RepID=F5YBK1_LEAAZ|nr:tetratricopeptide repeat protein [Leadbettera azotonutricia]AEF80897.1 putative TPR domain protein [Leadbettera azotonutricia ZAS-9]